MKNSSKLLLVGAACLLGGILALANPFAASLATEIFLGWMFLIAGASGLAVAFTLSDDRLGTAFVALAMILIGIFMLFNPLAGLVALTVLIAMMLLISGMLRILLARSMAGSPGFWFHLLSGGLSVVLGLALFAGFPKTAENLIGLFLGLELVLVAVALLSLGWKMRNNDP